MSPQTTTKTTHAPTLSGAAEAGDADGAARLLASGASANERSAHGGETPLMRAAARGHEEVVRVLLDAGADACARRGDGFTPLILAVFFGHERVVRLLIERGADAHARTGLGTTAARWAEARGFASMAEVLREAEALRPRPAVVPGVEKDRAVRSKALSKTTPDDVEIFQKGRVREDREESESKSLPLSVVGDDSSPSATAAGVAVRRGEKLPAHPSASAFRLRDFLSSWQGALGALLLLTAFGVAVFALMQNGNAPRGAAQPAPTPAPLAPQAAQQVPAPPTPAPSPAFPTPDPQGITPAPEQGYPVPNTAGQPFYVPPGPVAPVPSDVPRDLTVVSESGSTSPNDAGQSGRRTNTNTSAPPRNDNASEAAPRAARTPEPEPPRPAAPAPTQPPPPATQPTPRAKVIQWPPQ